MEKNTALILLGFDLKSNADEESIEIALEEAIFKEASFFMNRNFIPGLANARMRKLSLLAEAAAAFEMPFPERGEDRSPSVDYGEIGQAENLTALLNICHRYEMDIKLALANEENPNEIINLLKKWNLLFLAYAKRFTILFEALDVNISNTEITVVPATRIIDYNELITDLRSEIFTKAVSLEYFRIKKIAPKSS